MLRIVEGPIWVIIGVIISVWSFRTGLGTFKEPGVGFVAFASGLFIIAVGGFVAVLRRPRRQEVQASDRHQTPDTLSTQGSVLSPHTSYLSPSFVESAPFKLTYTLALLLFYALLLDRLGYIIMTFIVLLGLFFDPVHPRRAGPLLASFLSVAVTYLVFEVWLRSQLPRGILPWW
jgi:hypothetical protein